MDSGKGRKFNKEARLRAPKEMEMKKRNMYVLGLILYLLVLFFIFGPVPAHGQNNIGMWQVGGTWTRLRVLSAIDRPVIASIGNSSKVLYKEQAYEVRYGYGWQGNVAVTVDVCTGRLQAVPAIAPPPQWAMATIGDYDPAMTVKDLRQKVDAAEKQIKGRLGEKMMKRQLEGWFRAVKKYGVDATMPACTDSIPLVYTADVTQWGYARTITVVVKQNQGGYFLQPLY